MHTAGYRGAHYLASWSRVTEWPTLSQDSLEALEKDTVLKEALGAEFVDYFLQLKRDEVRIQATHTS